MRGFQQAHHAQTGLAVGQWGPPFANGIQKFSDHVAQGFGGIELGRPHVAGAITHQSLVISFAIGADTIRGDAFVIDAHFLSRFDVIVKDHLAAAGDHGAANLDRGQPVKMKMRDKVAGKVQHQISDVFNSRLDVTTTDRTQAIRLSINQVIHDRKIVRRQIPKHVDVFLE